MEFITRIRGTADRKKIQNKYVSDTVAPRLGEIQSSAVNGGGADANNGPGVPFPALQNSPEVTATGRYSDFEFLNNFCTILQLYFKVKTGVLCWLTTGPIQILMFLSVLLSVDSLQRYLVFQPRLNSIGLVVVMELPLNVEKISFDLDQIWFH